MIIPLAAALIWVRFQLGSEKGRIRACARDAAVLSGVCRKVQDHLYADADHFLGKKPRPNEAEGHAAVETAYAQATKSAAHGRVLFNKTLSLAAREMFLAAGQERNLAASPSGNWISFQAELAKARARFDSAKGRFDLDQPASSDERVAEAKAREELLRPLTAAALKDQADEEARTKQTLQEARSLVERIEKTKKGKWLPLSSTDRVTGKETIAIVLASENSVAGGQTALLSFSCYRGEHLYGTINPHALIDYNSADMSNVTMRLDDDQPIMLRMIAVKDSDGTLLFPPWNNSAIIDQLSKHDKMLARISLLRGSQQIIEFDLRRFSEALAPLLPACSTDFSANTDDKPRRPAELRGRRIIN